jgi:hypothetical protein
LSPRDQKDDFVAGGGDVSATGSELSLSGGATPKNSATASQVLLNFDFGSGSGTGAVIATSSSVADDSKVCSTVESAFDSISGSNETRAAAAGSLLLAGVLAGEDFRSIGLIEGVPSKSASLFQLSGMYVKVIPKKSSYA